MTRRIFIEEFKLGDAPLAATLLSLNTVNELTRAGYSVTRKWSKDFDSIVVEAWEKDVESTMPGPARAEQNP